MQNYLANTTGGSDAQNYTRNVLNRLFPTKSAMAKPKPETVEEGTGVRTTLQP